MSRCSNADEFVQILTRSMEFGCLPAVFYLVDHGRHRIVGDVVEGSALGVVVADRDIQFWFEPTELQETWLGSAGQS